MKNELTKWRFIFVVSYLNMLEKKRNSCRRGEWEKKERERETEKYESHSFYGTQLGPPNAKRNETHETVPFTTASQRPTKIKTCERKKKTSIVDVIKKNELGGMRGETNTDSKR